MSVGERPAIPSTPDTPDTGEPTRRPSSVNLTVFVASAAIVLAFAIWALAAPETAETVINEVRNFITRWFGWWYFILATAIVGLVVFLGVSKYGRYRLGPEESRPEYSLFTWTSMLFAAGIGIDLMFFSVAEPVTHFLNPPTGAAETNFAAREAVTWTVFHYGITGWAMYALMGGALAYFAFRHNLPLTIRAALYPIFGKRVEGRWGDAIDVAAVLGTIFGIATSLGIGVVQLNFGLNEIFGIEQGKAAQIGLIALSVVIATASATSGVDKGIRRLSEINVILAIGMLIYITVAKDADFLLNGLVQNAGDYVSTFADRTLDTFAWDQVNPQPGNDARAFVDGWTLFFWAWWVAWAPFVGLFLARISRGRTLRQFVFGVLVVPFSFILVWISIFGNSALQAARGDKEFAETTASAPEAGFYSLLEQYPGATLLIGIATITGLLFYVTSADSGSLVMGNFTSRLDDPMADCSRSLRIFWSVAIGLLTLSMLFAGGGDGSILTLQAATVIMGLPFSFVLGLIGISLLRAVRTESYKLDSYRTTLPKVIAVGRGPTEQSSWRHRLIGTLRFPGRIATRRYITATVVPAMHEVAEQFGREGVSATVDESAANEGLPSPRLIVKLADVPAFEYCVWPVSAPTPTYAVRSQRSDDRYFRCEVYLTEGSQGYSLSGYTREQIIGDILDQYERHLGYLHLRDSASDHHDHTAVDHDPDTSGPAAGSASAGTVAETDIPDSDPEGAPAP
ncbi:choline BCCT transporter BetT [Gordonia alkanivorans]|jgi:choline/glycine/proline betaine transport protein|uniref:Putative choline transporter n=1 Tax=Gordonia alkanivorans NBRC 16433 TaxID=1027371 RepID=F9VUH5_9ACTN|nr:choline BCCT transporter BetT [Gordonia alkanivorans]MDH3016157.1 choline BCCT transporter BetT [Gordonia alkanivorans]MDH3019735.1 choline BCCT transporter BetT [Gordonia alkanivorans]MDH3040997.1 choline BCCT transporter BetT [Gordonia alkanivorans]MDH3048194.1 choline BCCT transporter BetT [Gordonia alkanivorans]MDH3060782.1 choline BCCT transporter BetT [Gordonia alkanivorans]